MKPKIDWRSRTVLLPASALVWFCGTGVSAFGDSDVGQVNFPVSANASAQDKFNRAVAMLHSFWYEELDDAFSQVSSDDPRCGMAYWGLAMSYYHPLWTPPDPAALRKGWAAVQRAKALEGVSERERDYIDAIEVFYRDWEKTDHRARSLGYCEAMRRLCQKYPKDKEAAIFYALSLVGTARPEDKTYTNQKQAASILEQVRVEMPDHPGVIHYIIHAYDSPPLAQLALPAARRYAQVAPAIPHAQHMPSHIFTRLGLWGEAIKSNEDSVASAKAYARKTGMKGVWDEQIHSMDYLVYAALQCAQDGKARSVVDEVSAVRRVNQEGPKVAYPVAAIPARYALERKRWKEAAGLTAPDWIDLESFPWAKAMFCFARGVGAARSGDKAGAQAELSQIDSIHQALIGKQEADWALFTKILKQEVAAWLAAAEGRREAAIEFMTAAAVLEDSVEKLPLTPGPIIPAREQLGELLLEGKDFEGALRAFETSLRTSPDRFNGVFGAAKAALAAGRRDDARVRFARLVEVCQGSDSDRAGLVEARAFLSSK